MRASRWILLVIVVFVLLAGGGGVWWYVSVPHTAEAQFAYAEKLEKELRGDAVTKTGKELQEKIEMTIEQYRRVGTRFGKSPKAAEAVKRIAKIHEEISKDAAKAMAVLDQLAKEYPDEENAGYALMDQARLIRIQADALKAEKKPEAEGKYREALAKLEEYRKKFEKGKEADAALMEIGRIWQDGLEEPPIHAIETFKQVLKDYPHSEYEPEAMYRLAQVYREDQGISTGAGAVREAGGGISQEQVCGGRDLCPRQVAGRQDGQARRGGEGIRENGPAVSRRPAGRAGGGSEAKEEKDKAAAEEGGKVWQIPLRRDCAV